MGSVNVRMGAGVGLVFAISACEGMLGIDALYFDELSRTAGSNGADTLFAGQGGEGTSNGGVAGNDRKEPMEPDDGGAGATTHAGRGGGNDNEGDGGSGASGHRGGASFAGSNGGGRAGNDTSSGGDSGGSDPMGGAGFGGSTGASSGDSGAGASGSSGDSGTGGSGGVSGASGNSGDSGAGGSAGVSGTSGSGGVSGSGGSSGTSGAGGSGGGPVLVPIPVPWGYQKYCSMSDGLEYEFSWDDDPCEHIMAQRGWTAAQIDRAGVFDPVGQTFVVMQCAGDHVTGTWNYKSPGTVALEAALAEARRSDQRGVCVFTASPRSLPALSAPFSIEPLPAGFQMSSSAYDFATLPGSPVGSVPAAELNISVYSEVACAPSSCVPKSSSCSRVVNFRGQDRSCTDVDNQQGFTWAMAAGAPVLAMGPGEVVEARDRPVVGCHTSTQNELYVRHVIADSLDSRYAEIMIAYYAHLDFAPGITKGSIVERGQIIGYVSNNGCTQGRNQLHVAVIRASNTAREYRPELDTRSGIYGANGTAPDNSVARIDPWGWAASQARPHMDPGGYVWYHWSIPGMGPNGDPREGGGALSVALFYDRQAPPRSCDEEPGFWAIQGAGAQQNPFAHCPPLTEGN